jgi:hypothetical protein
MEGNYLPRISAVQLTARAYNSAIEKHSSLTVAHMQSLIQDGAEKKIHDAREHTHASVSMQYSQ